MNYFHTPLFAFAALVAPVLAADNWTTDLPAALQEAAKSNKVAMVDFNGSDWCGPCIQLRKNVFDSEEFLQYASDKFVLVDIDFPRKSELPAEQMAANRALADTFAVRAYPTVLVLNQDQVVVGGFLGGRDFPAVKEALDAAVARQAVISELMAKAATLEGVEKAKVLIEVYNSVPDDIKKNNAALKKQIIAADPEDATKFVADEEAKVAKEAAVQSAISTFYKEIRQSPIAERAALIDEMLQRPACTAEVAAFLKQTKLFTQLSLAETEADLDKVKADMKAYAASGEKGAENMAAIIEQVFAKSPAELLKQCEEMRKRM